MNRSQKEEVINTLREELGGAASIVVTDVSGMDVESVNELRGLLRAKGVRYQVAKNTLIRRAIADSSVEAMAPLPTGPTAMAWHPEEPATAAKIIKGFAKENDKLTVRGGYIDGDTMEGDAAIAALSEMPSKDELRAKVLGLMKMVPGKFLALMQTAPKKGLALLLARQAKLEEEGGE